MLLYHTSQGHIATVTSNAAILSLVSYDRNDHSTMIAVTLAIVVIIRKPDFRAVMGRRDQYDAPKSDCMGG